MKPLIFEWILFCNSALDAESERIVQDALNQVIKGTLYMFCLTNIIYILSTNIDI